MGLGPDPRLGTAEPVRLQLASQATPEEATEVEIRFVPLSAGETRVEIEHRGWERLGSEGQTWRDRNRGGWETLLPHYVGAVQAA